VDGKDVDEGYEGGERGVARVRESSREAAGGEGRR